MTRNILKLILMAVAAAPAIAASFGISGALASALRIEAGSSAYTVVFALSLLLVTIFAYVIFRIFLLVRDRMSQMPGSRIRIRFSVYFVIASLLPLLVFSVFSYSNFKNGMDMLYNPEIENALDLAIQYAQESSEAIRHEFIAFAQRYFRTRTGVFDEREKKSGLLHFEQIGRYDLAGGYLPPGLKRRLTAMALESEVYSDEFGHSLTYYRIQGGFAEYAALGMNPALSAGTERISLALTEYRQLRLMRRPFEIAFLSFAVLFAIFVILISLLLALRFARITTEPVRVLVEGTQRIAGGELGYRIPVVGLDEFRQLMESFNNMSNQLAQSKQRLHRAERFAAWQEVAQRLAHEIKNPLTPIQLGAERLLRMLHKGREGLPLVLEKVLPAIITEVKAIKDLVNEFASFARLPAKHVMPVRVEKFLEETLDTLKASHEEIDFTLEIKSEIGDVLFDREQMRRAIINILQNAINAIAKTERRGEVQVVAEKIDNEVLCIIRDNGCGIPAGTGDAIFTPYFSRQEGGTGLGLSIVEKIVYDHGGRVWYESSPGGTSFYFTIGRDAADQKTENE
ncbi:MAG: HAMP domain-containing protein [Spirochaetota bacterium]|jgi:nitrogen fixation/metabolism regulation signal transduction histidine kinase|nr:HAMP domain-containing protein [Spirochaetota bacterium]